MYNKGIFTISLDLELAWGSFDKGISDSKLEAIKKTRYCIDSMIALFEKYEISVTWAITGHLMIDSCIITDGVKHPNIVRPNHSWYNKDWFEMDPANGIEENSIWYGIDILRKIRESKILHEVGSHSFSHIIYGDKGCSRECAESDIKECIHIADEKNIKLKSFVFPRNSEGYKDLLKKYGFICYRGNGTEWYKKYKSTKLKQIAHIIDEILAISPTTSLPVVDEFGLYNIQGNMLYLSRDGIRRLIPVGSRVMKAKKGIDKAIKEKKIFHLWFHPFNIGTDPDNLLKGIEEILIHVNKKRELGLLQNLTMEEIVNKDQITCLK